MVLQLLRAWPEAARYETRSKMLLQLSRLLSKFAPAVVPQSLPEAVRKQLKQPPV